MFFKKRKARRKALKAIERHIAVFHHFVDESDRVSDRLTYLTENHRIDHEDDHLRIFHSHPKGLKPESFQ